MGLDITAYEKVTLKRAMSVQEYNKDEDAQSEADQDEMTLLYQDGNRPQSDEMADGLYATGGKSFGFRAGSYSGYNEWRRALARAMLDMTDRQVWALTAEGRAGKPFVELIHFSDCEGFIGPKTSAKLAKDFADHRSKIPAMADPWFVEKYDAWAKAFALAADHGAVKFH